MTKKFFDEFQTSTKKDWEAQAIKDLKGKNFEQTLVWNTPEGFQVQPYYAEEDLAAVPVSAIQQAQASKKKPGWQNRASISFVNEKQANKAIIEALQNGVHAVAIDLSHAEVSGVDIPRLLDKIKLSDTPVYFKTNNYTALLSALKKYVAYQPKGGLIFDSLGDFFSGRAPVEPATWKSAKNLIMDTAASPAFYVLAVQSETFHNAGANTVQELAFTLASAVTYLDKLTDEGLTAVQVASKIEFSLAIGTNYFMEIAKIRSLRYLWSRVLTAYGLADTSCRIHCHNSYFYDAVPDAHTNMLRATTEAMAAVIGGCDSLGIHGYDAVFTTEPSETSNRIARNIANLLSDESYMGKSRDVAAGSYYLENLTNDLSTAAWNLFLAVEQKGGILAAFEEEFVQTEIEKAYQEKVAQLQNGKVMVGVNRFKSPFDTPQILPAPPDVDKHFLPVRRLSTSFE